MSLKKLKDWLRRIASAEDQEKEGPPSGAAGGKSFRIAADQSPAVRQASAHHQDAPGEAAPPVGKDAAARPPGSKTRPRRLTRQGIPILDRNEDLTQHFMGRADAKDEASPKKAFGRNAPDQKIVRGPAAPRHIARNRKTPATRRNRLGIRQLDDNRDLHAYFLPAASEGTKPLDRPSTKAAAAPKRKSSRRPAVGPATDRHGIPRLDDQADLRQFFETALEDDEDIPANEGLGEVFRASLNHDTRRLMKKKTGGFFAPRRLSLKEKLRRYPAPQAQLDLHGDTALIARQRTDSFLRTAGAAGTLTVRIIVGKGLHSEEGAVLPDVIEDLLVALKRDGRVLTFRWDKELKRKSGAVIVYLQPLF